MAEVNPLTEFHYNYLCVGVLLTAKVTGRANTSLMANPRDPAQEPTAPDPLREHYLPKSK